MLDPRHALLDTHLLARARREISTNHPDVQAEEALLPIRINQSSLLTIIIAVACSLGLGACSASSSSRAQEPAATAAPAPAEPIEAVDRSAEYDAFEKLGYRIDWRGFPFVGSDRKVQFFDIFGDTIVVQDESSAVTAMDPVTGRNRWSTRLAGDLTRFVGNARRGDSLLFASDIGLYVLDARTGTIKDKQRLAVVVNTPPVVDGNMAIFGCTSGELLGHNLASGFKQWGYLLNGSITASPVVAGAGVGAVSQGGDVIIVDPRNGKSFGRALIFDGISNNPAAGANTLYVASRDQSVYAFNASNGKRIWRYRTQSPLSDQPTAYNGRLYIAIPDEGLVAFNGATGEVIWKAPGVRGEAIGIHKGLLLVWNGAVATLIDDRRGDIVETVTIPGLKSLKMTTFVDGDLYTVRPNGVVGKYTAID